MNTEIARMEKDLEKMRDNIYNTFDAFLGGRKPQADTDYMTEWVPAADVSEDKDGFTLRVALPGVKKEEVDTEIKENILIISGKRDPGPEAQKGLVRQEIPVGRFYRAFKIGVQVNSGAVKASLKDGILEVRLPKSEEAKPNKIRIE
jgi:HSP20 family protein